MNFFRVLPYYYYTTFGDTLADEGENPRGGHYLPCTSVVGAVADVAVCHKQFVKGQFERGGVTVTVSVSQTLSRDNKCGGTNWT